MDGTTTQRKDNFLVFPSVQIIHDRHNKVKRGREGGSTETEKKVMFSELCADTAGRNVLQRVTFYLYTLNTYQSFFSPFEY